MNEILPRTAQPSLEGKLLSRGAAAALADVVAYILLLKPLGPPCHQCLGSILSCARYFWAGFFFFFPCNLGLVFWDDSARNAKRYGCFLALAESCHVLGATQRGDGTPLPALGWLGTLSLGRSQGFSVGPGSFQSKVQVQKTQH